ncbi:hypothetical protein IQ264_00750 [Phormidium sp. LEGE 05292]|uniref:hypothetical protein n=1 Tax=[Phormidium] sp. LEGE 05292 TaxID=767427 RepID=UPI00187FC173|nr:hypothetical protein [Phormidium sp. LEGE 05292]MBE9224005.1 hypothetical protein [Phormidium sp. LEGE 05292]
MSTDIAKAVMGVSAGIDAIKKLGDLAVKSQNLELREGILSLREQLLEAKDALLDAKEQVSNYKEENATLKTRITELEQRLANGKEEIKLTVKKGGYYKEDGDGPYCTGCYDNDKKLIRVTDVGPIWRCPVCRSVATKT